MVVRLRPVTDSDLLAVGALHHRSRADAYAHILSAETLAGRSAAALGEYWAERWKWERDTHRMTVADDDDAIVGFTYLGPSETDGAAELYGIHVDPAYVGTGLGRQLMIDALAHVSGVDRVVLWVLEDNEHARRFYERGGWQADGATRTEPVNDQPVPQLRYSYWWGGSARPS